MPEALVDAIAMRGERSESIREGLERYYYLLERAREQIRPLFTAGECSLLVDTCNGTLFGPITLDCVPLDVRDVEEERVQKWGVDREALLAKLQGLNLLQHAALVDAIERFWQAASHGFEVDPSLLLK